MKKLLLAAGVVLLSLPFVWAQQSDQSGDSTARVGTVRGCLGGSDGNYTLTQGTSGTMFRLVGNDDQLKSHIGQEVLVTGQLSEGGSAASSGNQASNLSANSAASSTSGNMVQVSNVKVVSQTCSTGNEPSQY